MEDTTKLFDEGPEPAIAPALDELLISIGEKWEERPEPRHVDACDSLRRYGVFRNSGDTASHPVQCKSWDHQPCAEKHAKKELWIIGRLVGESGRAFFASVPSDEFFSGRLSHRRDQWKVKTAERVWYRWYRRDDGTVWVLASHPLDGRKLPVEFHRTDDPLRLAAMALRLPGVARVDGSRIGDLLPDDEREEDVDEDKPRLVEWIGTAGPDGWEGVKRAAAAEAKRRFGYDVDPVFPLLMPRELSIDQWIECLRSARHI